MFRSFSLAALLVAAGFCSAYPPVPKAGKEEEYKPRPMPLYYPHLLLDAGIQKSVELSEDQKKKIHDQIHKFCEDEDAKQQERIAKINRGAGMPPPIPQPNEIDDDDMRTQIQVVEARERVVKPIMETVLKPEQTLRIRQIDTQLQGPAGLVDRRMIRYLKLTEEQEDKMEDAVFEFQKGRGEIEEAFDAEPTEEDLQKMAAIYGKVMKKCQDLLTPAQRKLYAERTGKPVPAKELMPLIRQGNMAYY